MPFRHLLLNEPTDFLNLRIPGEHSKECNSNPTDEEWNDWMKWEGGSDPSFLPENPSLFEDAPFEFEEPLFLQSEPNNGVFSPMFENEKDSQNYPSLSKEEQQNLQNIAMPYLFSQATISSEPSSPTLSHTSTSACISPEPESPVRKTRKRKSTIDTEVPLAVCQSRKRGHNAIEKRYRTNLNEKINCLRQGVPSLCKTPTSESVPSATADREDGDDSENEEADSKKYGKAAILTRALEYIQHLETTTQRLGSEVMVLKTRVGAFEKLAMSGSVLMNPGPGAQMAQQLAVKCETLESIQFGEHYS